MEGEYAGIPFYAVCLSATTDRRPTIEYFFVILVLHVFTVFLSSSVYLFLNFLFGWLRAVD